MLGRWTVKLVPLSLAAVLTMGVAGTAHADGRWAQTHPRRDQVNDRLANQTRRIHQEVKEGELTKSQAASLHRQDHQVREEERLMASQDGGHITKPEQRVLNQQENKISREIGP